MEIGIEKEEQVKYALLNFVLVLITHIKQIIYQFSIDLIYVYL